MPAFDKSKRSVVKHKTHKPFTASGGSGGSGRSKGPDDGKKRGGFKVGPAHAPDGAYLGRAKRIKANLIANAKTKKQYYKSLQQEQQGREGQRVSKGKRKREDGEDEGSDPERGAAPAPALGRFAPQHGGGEGSSAGESAVDLYERARNTPRPPRAGQGQRQRLAKQQKKEGGAGADADGAQPHGTKPTSASMPTPTPTSTALKRKRPERTREEALEARREEREKWNAKSRSVLGAKRGQPDLGSRMQVLLGKIARDN